jgi:hypothetical protein
MLLAMQSIVRCAIQSVALLIRGPCKIQRRGRLDRSRICAAAHPTMRSLSSGARSRDPVASPGRAASRPGHERGDALRHRDERERSRNLRLLIFLSGEGRSVSLPLNLSLGLADMSAPQANASTPTYEIRRTSPHFPEFSQPPTGPCPESGPRPCRRSSGSRH